MSAKSMRRANFIPNALQGNIAYSQDLKLSPGCVRYFAQFLKEIAFRADFS